jgi:GxxExxY protein
MENSTPELPGRDLDSIARRIAVCARAVNNALGPGKDLQDYEGALDRALKEERLQFAWQYPIGIPFYGPQDRGFRADFIVEGWTLLELAAVDQLTAENADLALNYLRESGCKQCLLINFGNRKIEIKRILLPVK